MKFLANENIPLQSIELLRAEGHDVKAVGEAFPAIKDHEVIEKAEEEERTIITFDQDYGELIHKHGHRPKSGIIQLRLRSITAKAAAQCLLKILNEREPVFQDRITVIDEKRMRQRKY